MDFLAIGALFFLAVVAFSVGLEIRDRYHEARDGGGRGFRLLPRRNYYQLHGEVYQPTLPPISQSPNTFLVKREEGPVRCEICHQSDMFEGTTGHCSRCNHITH